MSANAYLELMKKQEKELTDFPIAYAFDERQLTEALSKIGATDISECCTVCGHGDIVKKTDARAFVDMLKRHIIEVKKLIQDKDIAYEAFLYEMDNHEYAINWDADDDVMGCFSVTFDELKNMDLLDTYYAARKAHMKHAEEWGMI